MNYHMPDLNSPCPHCSSRACGVICRFYMLPRWQKPEEKDHVQAMAKLRRECEEILRG